MPKIQPLKPKSMGKFLYGFLPSKKVFIVGVVFYIIGLVFAYLEPNLAKSMFSGGLYVGDLKVHIEIPPVITLDYLIHQFVYYLGAASFHIYINNLLTILVCIFTGIAIIPIILIGLFSATGTATYLLVGKVGLFRAFLILLGSFHLYFEFLAAFLSIDAFLKFYGSFIKAIRKKSFDRFKKEVLEEFIPLLLKIALLLAAASLLEVFWSTWWVYINTHPYVSWHDFYFGVYSAMVH